MIQLLLSLALAQSLAAHVDKGYETERDIPYRTEVAAVGEKSRCKLDVYYPRDATNYATIVWFHGGGLTGGDREIPERLKGKGIAIVAPSYRLSPQVKVVNCIEDAAAAVAWTVRNMPKRGASVKKFFISGHSAGGYLASMIVLDKRWLRPYGIDPDTFAGLAPFSGQAITHFTMRKERGIPERQPVIDEYAPIYYVRKDAPPILLLSGDRDRELYGRYEENAYFWRMLKEVGHPQVKLLELQGYDHGGMADPGFPLLLDFVREQSQKIDAKSS